jgi:subtilase family serine protease
MAKVLLKGSERTEVPGARVLDGVSGHVDFPASSPYVLGCGGTTLTATPT